MIDLAQLQSARQRAAQVQSHWAAQLHEAQALISRAKAQRDHAQLQLAMAQGHLDSLDWMIGLVQPDGPDLASGAALGGLGAQPDGAAAIAINGDTGQRHRDNRGE